MKVIRKRFVEVKSYRIGDQIIVGRYTATAVAQDKEGTTFCLDSVYGSASVTPDKIELALRRIYLGKAFSEIRDKMIPVYPASDKEDETTVSYVRCPTAQELFAPGIIPKEFMNMKVRIPGANKRWNLIAVPMYHGGVTKNGLNAHYWTESFIDCEEGGRFMVAAGLGTLMAVTSAYIRPVFKLKNES